METNLTIRSTGKFGNKGERYEILLGDEIMSVGASPEFAACRVLKDRGVAGKAAFWRAGKAYADFHMPIEWAAARTISETAKTGPRIVKWAPNPIFGKEDFVEMSE